jgi:ABC-type sulfate/molybdate transport systems ATPase subunit
MAAGKVRQAGPQPEVFAHPADPLVARLLGVRNLRSAELRDGVLIDGDLRIPVAAEELDGAATWCIRPEELVLTERGGTPAVVRDVMYLGGVAEVVVVTAGDTELTAQLPMRQAPGIGTAVEIVVRPDAITVWSQQDTPVEGGRPALDLIPPAI